MGTAVLYTSVIAVTMGRISFIGREVKSTMSSLMQGDEFQHILRILNTNVEGKRNVVFAMTKIGGIGHRFSDLICKKAEVDVNKRAGELTADEIEKIVAYSKSTSIQNPPLVSQSSKGFQDRKIQPGFCTKYCRKLA